jgi:hypothetical protein
MSLQEFFLDFAVLTVLFLVFMTPFWILIWRTRRDSGYVRTKSLRSTLAKLEGELKELSLEDLIDLGRRIQTQLEDAKKRYDQADPGGALRLAGKFLWRSKDWLTNFKTATHEHADGYNEYMELHELSIAVRHLMRQHSDIWKGEIRDANRLKLQSPQVKDSAIPPTVAEESALQADVDQKRNGDEATEFPNAMPKLLESAYEADSEPSVPSSNSAGQNMVDLKSYLDAQRLMKVQNDRILYLRDQLKKLRAGVPKPSKDDLWNLADSKRFKNGTINYSNLARELGVTYHTAKKWCQEYDIK